MDLDSIMAGPSTLIAEWQPFIEGHLSTLEGMIQPNGAISAAPHDGYSAFWVRDGLYALKGFEYVGMHSQVKKMMRVPFTIFHEHDMKICEGIRHKPNSRYEFLHARYHPTNLTELKDDWGHNQMDMLGLFLFETADLLKKNIPILPHEGRREDIYLINKVTRYLETLEWWKCPDFGVWEEGPDLHSSSIGAVLGGMQRIADLDNPQVFFNEKQLVHGRKALDKLLPLESSGTKSVAGREYDLAQLSLLWPFRVCTYEQASTIMKNIEENLVRDKGVVRYPKDPYYNAADDRMKKEEVNLPGIVLAHYDEADKNYFPCANEGTEAQWPLGFAWLSIVHSKWAKSDFEKGRESYKLNQEKAKHYLEKLKEVTLPVDGSSVGYIPELYVGDVPNINTPLAWSTSFAVAAAEAYKQIEDPNTVSFVK